VNKTEANYFVRLFCLNLALYFKIHRK